MERKGIELDFGPNEDLPVVEVDGVPEEEWQHPTTIITVARAGGSNDKFSKSLEVKYRPYRTQIDNETMDEKVAERLLAEAFAETIVMGWAGVSSLDVGLTQEGEELYEVKFSVENCVKLFTNLPEHFRDVRTQAMKFANYRRAELDFDIKN
jgi:hypothetical protein